MADIETGLSVKNYLGKALRLLLKPMVKLFIDQGVTYQEFCVAAKESYVEVALRAQPAVRTENLSSVAIITGLTRDDVLNVLEKALDEKPYSSALEGSRRILHEWHNKSDYTGPYGMPSEIPFRPKTDNSKEPSFAGLVESQMPGYDPKKVLHELLRVGAVTETDKDTYKVLRRVFEPEGLSPELIERFGDVSFNLMTTLAFNVQKKKVGEGIFDRRVLSNKKLNEVELDLFSKYLNDEAQLSLEKTDNWLTNNVSEKAPDSSEQVYDSGLVAIHYTVRQPELRTTLRHFLVENGFRDSVTASQVLSDKDKN